MSEKKRYNFKKILAATLWIILGSGTVALLVAAMNKKNSERCKSVAIKIKGVQNNLFIDNNDVMAMLEKMNLGKLEGKPLTTFDLIGMENILQQNEWIKNAELYFDNNDVLRINISEKEPVARIFNTAGSSFYIDSSLSVLQLSNKFSARLPVFTNFSSSTNSISKEDSNLLAGIKNISAYILKNPFWMAQIEQVDITAERDFEMIPKIGNHVIVFGPADDYADKFNNLLIFYRNVACKTGWNKYSKINVSYKNQVIGVKRGVEEIKMDALKTIQLMKLLVANAQKQANDSAGNIQLVQPKDDNNIPVSQGQDDKLFGIETIFDQPEKNTNSAFPAIPAPVVNNPSLPAKSQEKINSKNINIVTNTKENSNAVEKPKPVLNKKVVVKPTVTKSLPAPQLKPKEEMPPKNDY